MQVDDAFDTTVFPLYEHTTGKIQHPTSTIMADIQMDDAPSPLGIDKEPLFSEQEKKLLDMYDQIQKLELEVALTKARVHLAGE